MAGLIDGRWTGEAGGCGVFGSSNSRFCLTFWMTALEVRANVGA